MDEMRRVCPYCQELQPPDEQKAAVRAALLDLIAQVEAYEATSNWLEVKTSVRRAVAVVRA